MKIESVVDILGFEARDIITGASGVITSVCFDLYGCIQVVLTPSNKKSGENYNTWFDINRIVVSKKRIMDPVNFENKYNTFSEVQGPAEKPVK